MNVLIKAVRLALRVARTDPLCRRLDFRPRSQDVNDVFWLGDSDPDAGAYCFVYRGAYICSILGLQLPIMKSVAGSSRIARLCIIPSARRAWAVLLRRLS